MNVVGAYSFNGGAEYINDNYDGLQTEVYEIIARIDSGQAKTKISDEQTMLGRSLYSPRALNDAFKQEFIQAGWLTNNRIRCDYPTEYYVAGYQAPNEIRGAFREMDFIKDSLGVEVQFGKYAFMVYNVCAKMTIFHNHGFINAGVEIVPVKQLAADMSTGVSYFEQFVWDLEQRGVADIDIPVLILGIV